jgi:hypothetical protein
MIDFTLALEECFRTNQKYERRWLHRRKAPHRFRQAPLSGFEVSQLEIRSCGNTPLRDTRNVFRAPGVISHE